MINHSSSFLLFFIIICFTNQLQAQGLVRFDANNLKNGVIDSGVGSMNLCWLLDSDIERPRTNSMTTRINEMKSGSLRFPYGHLANNYLWDTPPYGGTLVPKVADSTAPPGIWNWATNPDGTFKKDMDFDEFMSLCSSTNTEPLVVINVLSYKYPNGPHYDTLKKVAVEWVKYAKNKGYKVAYWQLGNEMDHHQDLMTRAEYVALYQDFVQAMKAEDSTIHCGPGILNANTYFEIIMSEAPETVDFTSSHQYLFGKPWKDYAVWRESTISETTNNINNMQNAVNNSSKPDLPILITESNAYGNWENATNTALYKGLAWFDLLFEQQQYEDVKYTYMWNSHSPWGGEAGEESTANAWWNNDSNALTAMGWASYILNNTAEEKYMVPDNKINGKTHSYGAYTPGTGDMVIYLMNKDTASSSMNVFIDNFDLDTAAFERRVLSGTSAWDKYPTFQQSGSITFTDDGFSTSLPPYSLVVVKLKKATELPPKTYFLDNQGINKRMKSKQSNSDVELVRTTDQGWRGKWQLDSVGNGNFYIVSEANNMRLRGINSNYANLSSIELVDSTYIGSWVQWQLTQVDSSFFIDNLAHDVRLMASGSGEAVFGSKSWTGDWVRWKITDSSQESNRIHFPLQIAQEANEVLMIHPNPTASKTTINYKLTKHSHVKLRLYNIQGEVIQNLHVGTQKIGKYEKVLDTSNLSLGIYFVELDVAPSSGKKPFRSTRKLIFQ